MEASKARRLFCSRRALASVPRMLRSQGAALSSAPTTSLRILQSSHLMPACHTCRIPFLARERKKRAPRAASAEHFQRLRFSQDLFNSCPDSTRTSSYRLRPTVSLRAHAAPPRQCSPALPRSLQLQQSARADTLTVCVSRVVQAVFHPSRVTVAGEASREGSTRS